MHTRGIIIKQATEQDDLTALLGPLAAYRWNRSNVLVAEHEGQIKGLVLLWDGGHQILHADNLVVADGSDGIGLALIRGVEKEARRRGATVVTASTANVRLAAAASKAGVKVSVPLFALWQNVDEKGA